MRSLAAQGLILGLIISSIAHAQPAEVTTPTPTETAPPVAAKAPLELPFTGSLSSRYRLKTTGDDYDHVLEPLLSMETRASENSPWYASLQAAGRFDLNSNNATSPFRDVYDSMDGPAVGRLYHAYIERRDTGPFKYLRAGRQTRYEFEALYFDGADLETSASSGVSAQVFGGVPVHLFENQIGHDPGDWMVGTALQWDFQSIFRARADYVHLRDSLSGFRADVGDQEDDLFGLSLWWDAAKGLSVNSRFTSFSDQVRDLSLGTIFKPTETDFTLRFYFYTLLEEYGVRVTDLDMFSFAGSYQPFFDFQFSGTKSFGRHFALDSGFGLRILEEEQVASAFNHGFERLFVTLNLYDPGVKNLSFSVTGDYYHGEDNTLDDNTFGTSFSAIKDWFERKLKLEGGTAFYLYRYNILLGDESQNVQTFFARLDGKLWKQWTARLGYEFEMNDLDHVHTIDTRLAWLF